MNLSRILVVEDERLIAEDIKESLVRHEYEVTVASSERAVFQAIQRQTPDLVLMDIHLGGNEDGVNLAKKIRAKLRIPIVYLTSYVDEKTLERARTTQPYGYLVKPFQEPELHATVKMAISKFREEQKHLDETSLQALDDYIDQKIRKAVNVHVSHASPTIPLDHDLTPRERELLQYIGSGQTMNEIACRLHLSIHTVRTHRSRIMQKLDIHDIEKLVHYALSNSKGS